MAPSTLNEAGTVIMKDLQKNFQAEYAKARFVHLTGKGDRLTSVIIPAGMSLVAGGMVVRGLFNMYLGRGKKEGF